MGRPKGSKNKSKKSNTPPEVIRGDVVEYTVTAQVDVKFKIKLSRDSDPYQHFKHNTDMLVRAVSRGDIEFETASVKRYEW